MSAEDADFIPPPAGPPPPEVPPGWAARWDTRYNTFFYVHLATKKSQWEKPPGTIDRFTTITTSPSGARQHSTPSPPSHTPAVHDNEDRITPRTPEEARDYDQKGRSASPSSQDSLGSCPTHSPRAYASHSPTPTLPQSSKSHSGRLTKIRKFFSPRTRTRPQQHQFPYPVQGQGQYDYCPQSQPYNVSATPYQPSMPYGHPPPQMMFGSSQAQRQGIGAGGAAALGLGGGLLGGVLLGEFMGAHEYTEVFHDGADFGEYSGDGDFGGNDY